MPTPTPKTKDQVTIWYLLRFLKQYTLPVLFTLLFLIAARVTSALDPVWLKKIIDSISAGSGWNALGAVLAGYFGLRALTAAFDYLRDVVFAPAIMGISRTLSDQLFGHLLALPVSYHSEQRIGGVARQITRGGRAVTFILDFMVSSIIPVFFELIFVTYLLLRLYSAEYAIITAVTLIGYTVFTVWATEKRQKYRLAANVADDDVSSLEVDALSNIDTVKYFNSEPDLRQRYWPTITKRYNLQVSSNRLFALVASGQAAILLAGLGIILYLGIRDTVNGIFTIGDLVLLTTYISRLSGPIEVIGFVYRQIKDGLADLAGMANLLHEEITIKEPENPQKVEKPKGKIELTDVTFSYNGSDRKVLDDVSLLIKPGQKVAFVGPSGVGKSTIVKLLFRLHEPQQGAILIDGVPLHDLAKESRRDIFAIVPQEPALFNASIGDNIRFAKPDASQEEVEAAAKLANIHAFVETLPEKYDTVVGERGVKLSGGEKQRVAIARAVIRDPKILVFDEATSALDSHSEEIIQESLNRVAKGRTTVAIAHRLSTIADSDVIFVMKDGKVEESGTHRELLAKKGLYAQLWKIQAERKDKDAEEIV